MYQEDDEIEIDIIGILLVLKKKWLLIVLITVLGAVAGGVYSKTSSSVTYESTAKIGVLLDEKTLAATNNTEITNQLLSNYQSVIASHDTLESVIAKLGLQETIAQLEGQLTTEIISNTNTIAVSIIYEDATLAKQIVDEIVIVSTQYMKDLMETDSVQMISLGDVSVGLVSSNMARNALIGGVIGAFLVCGVIVLINILDNSIKSEDDVERRLQLPVLSALPESQTASYFYEEALRLLRTNISFVKHDVKVILLVGSTSQEGTSETSLALAKSFASIGKKVLLIDADMRKSSMASRISTRQNTSDLSQFLYGKKEVTEVICKTDIDGFDVILSNSNVQDAPELLAGQSFVTLLEQVKQDYDYIFIDTPPMSNLSDAVIVSERCDGVIFTIRNGKVGYRLAQKMKSQLEKGGCPILGAVITQIDLAESRYYYKQYGLNSRYDDI